MKLFILLSLVLFLNLFLGPGCGPAGEAASPAAEAESAEAEPLGATLFGERLLLYLEYPRPVAGEEVRFLAHVTVLATGEPLRNGRAVLQVGDVRLSADIPERAGVFVPAGSLPEAGLWPARLVLSSDGGDEVFELGEVQVHASREEALAAVDVDHHEHEDGIRFLMEQQWKVGLLLARAGPRTVTRRLRVPADVVAAEGSSALVSAPVAGRLLPPEGGALPRSGGLVTAGQELALVEPPLSTADGAQLRALELELDLKALEVEQHLAEARAHLRFTEADHARIADLLGEGLATQQQFDRAERDLTLARGAMEATEAARLALEEQWARRADQTLLSSDGLLRYRVQAPISGVLVGEGRVVGESLEADDLLFRIVDGSRVWIEGRVSEFDLPLVVGSPPAQVTFPAAPELRLDVGGSDTGGEPVLSPRVDPASRTAILRYELDVSDAVVRPGMLAELEVAVESVEADVVIPHEAVVVEGGLPFAFVLHEGELFERRELQLGLRDGELVEVLAGLGAGERVATRGATTVRLAAMAPPSFGHQHQH